MCSRPAKTSGLEFPPQGKGVIARVSDRYVDTLNCAVISWCVQVTLHIKVVLVISIKLRDIIFRNNVNIKIFNYC